MSSNLSWHLGQTSVYPEHYDAGLLTPIPRESKITPAAIYGFDDWTLYELSWLQADGKPIMAIAQVRFPHDSPYMIESKSLKLYCNSFNQTRFEQPITPLMVRDLSQASQSQVTINLLPVNPPWPDNIPAISHCLDDLILDSPPSSEPEPKQDLTLKVNEPCYHQRLHSHLFASHCPVTNQPDWASVYIDCLGPTIHQAGLLRYLLSYRRHQAFHEACVERIYHDLWQQGQGNIQQLTVQAFFTRRGGLDINPLRSSGPNPSPLASRHYRQ